MRVAYVCADPGIPVFGAKGCSLHVQEILRALTARGDSVDLFAVRVGGDPPPGLESVTTHLVPVARSSSAAEREQSLASAGESLAEMLEQNGPFELVYERHALWSAAAMQWAERRGVASILEVNAPLLQEQAEHRTLVDGELARQTAALSVTSAGVVACVSDRVTEYALDLGAEQGATMVVPNGVRPDLFGQRRPRANASSPFAVGFVGSLRPWHAVDDLYLAFGMMLDAHPLADSRLLVVGDGPRRESLEELIAAQPPERQHRFQLGGAVPPAEIPGWLSRFDVAVAPYAAEGDCYFSPLKLFEYMAAGLPIVAADCGQMSEVITHGQTGLLYQPGNLCDLRDQLSLLRDDPLLAEQMGAAARQEAAGRHSWNHRLDAILHAAGLVGGCTVVG
ncbi:2-deoxystreptamine glucosyltransferase [Posidoniimonas polymericola]|uniref:2-deoxystreptamine glucosyltransferase n=1 Tax=Posidoniimonas polymericola TaxID=2528002 RepID=A0A5C5XTQ7_9BACT|nr:glycosyltransferase family 4 protein [Posidoniimonas polymericola]TWT66264.1 2-deoxystreptamine glucosyltransferase [Posidoniimonas polymericola]